MSKMMMYILTFSSAKSYLAIFSEKINSPTLKGNFLVHSVNPILNMMLIYELL